MMGESRTAGIDGNAAGRMGLVKASLVAVLAVVRVGLMRLAKAVALIGTRES